jgi:hypothetical protein
MEAISGRMTIQEIAADHAIHQIGPFEHVLASKGGEDHSAAADLALFRKTHLKRGFTFDQADPCLLSSIEPCHALLCGPCNEGLRGHEAGEGLVGQPADIGATGGHPNQSKIDGEQLA